MRQFYLCVLITLALSSIVVSCVKEVEQRPYEREPEVLHDVIFHAGWASESKTVLQEDGSVWWSPGDKISLFTGAAINGGYMLDATIGEPSPSTDFVGMIGGGSLFSAIYPYDDRNYFDGTHFGVFHPGEQVAKEGSFANQSFISVAQSIDDNLYFRNVCGGIKISVANEGITKLYVRAMNGAIGGNLEYVLDSNGIPQFTGSGPNGGYGDLTVWAPEYGCFEPGKYYYIVLPAKTISDGLSITFYRGDDYAEWSFPKSVEIHRSVFKRLNRIDEGLKFHHDVVYDNAARLYRFLPDDIGKEAITEIEFHVKDNTITENQISASIPVYYEKNGTKVDIYTSADYYDISRVTVGMFDGYSALNGLDLSNTVAPEPSSLYSMFRDCRSLESIQFGEWDTYHVTTMEMMFNNCEKLHSLDMSFMDTYNVENMHGVFGGCKLLTSIDVSGFDTSKTTNMSGMFGGCKGLLSLDISSFDTKNVTNMSGMFEECSVLSSLNLSGFNTQQVKNFGQMFMSCEALKTLDLSSFDTRNAESMNSMFYECSGLESLDLSHFQTQKCQNMHFMFGWCTFLKELDISSFSSESLQTAELMFGSCLRLQKLNLGAFDISQANCQDIGQAIMRTSKSGAIRCITETRSLLEPTMDDALSGKIEWMTLSEDINTFNYQRDPNLYYSSDFSKHETVRRLYTATEGRGIDIVIMGDAYSDRMIESGRYDTDMKLAADAIFAKEPFASFKEFFNVYIVYLVSDNEVLGESTALDGVASASGVLEGYSSASVPDKYRILPTGNADLTVSDAIVVMNTEHVSGYANLIAWNFDVSYYDCDYGRGYSSVVMGRGNPSESEEFCITVAHEFGHSFAKLADEYYTPGESHSMNTSDISSSYTRFGWYKNVDLTSDPATIRWSQFIEDVRYASDGVGVFEGGFDNSTGVWRPSENSIMNTGTEFNAPSRAAIYNRIHKLAYGKEWQFDYETFVQWDLKNIGLEKRTTMSTSKAHHPHLYQKPIFKVAERKTEDRRTEINVIMN